MVISSTCHTTSPPLRPERGSGGIGPHLDAEPLRLAPILGVAGERQAELLLQRAALMGGARQAEDGFGERRAAGKGAVGRRHTGVGIEPKQAAIGLVGVEHAAGAVGDQRPLRQIVDEGLGDVVAGMPLAEMQDADGAGEQAEHADHGKAGKDGKHEGLGHLARHHGEPNRRNSQGQREEDHEPHAAVPLGAVGGGLDIAHRRLDIGHGANYPIRFVFASDIRHGARPAALRDAAPVRKAGPAPYWHLG